ncbi:MAG: hypothetical protein WC889_16285 [Myxococcota bacterium]|jgi:hypothetical protein
MRLFEPVIGDIRTVIANARKDWPVSEADVSGTASWPAGKRGGIVMRTDTAVELGSPERESVAFIVWTGELSLLHDGRMTLIGPDLAASTGLSLPFGKVVILGVKGISGENCHEIHRDLELMRFDMNLSGYMMRAVSQQAREWSRVGREAVAQGMSLFNLGASLAAVYRSNASVVSVEQLFITASGGAVRSLAGPCAMAQKLIGAMNKMALEPEHDCGSCDYTDVCREVDGLKSMRAALGKGAGNA